MCFQALAFQRLNLKRRRGRREAGDASENSGCRMSARTLSFSAGSTCAAGNNAASNPKSCIQMALILLTNPYRLSPNQPL